MSCIFAPHLPVSYQCSYRILEKIFRTNTFEMDWAMYYLIILLPTMVLTVIACAFWCSVRSLRVKIETNRAILFLLYACSAFVFLFGLLHVWDIFDILAEVDCYMNNLGDCHCGGMPFKYESIDIFQLKSWKYTFVLLYATLCIVPYIIQNYYVHKWYAPCILFWSLSLTLALLSLIMRSRCNIHDPANEYCIVGSATPVTYTCEANCATNLCADIADPITNCGNCSLTDRCNALHSESDLCLTCNSAISSINDLTCLLPVSNVSVCFATLGTLCILSLRPQIQTHKTPVTIDPLYRTSHESSTECCETRTWVYV